MKRDILYATGFFEIGDTFYDEHGSLHTVTDVLLCHYIRRGTYKILYEVDSSGEFQEILLRGFGDFPQVPPKESQTKSVMQFIPKNKPQSGGEQEAGRYTKCVAEYKFCDETGAHDAPLPVNHL